MSDSFVTPHTAAHTAPLAMGFPSQEHWKALSFPFPDEMMGEYQIWTWVGRGQNHLILTGMEENFLVRGTYLIQILTDEPNFKVIHSA